MDLKESDLTQFTCTDNWYKHPFVRGVLYTDGAKYVFDHGEAYWLLDEIAFAQSNKKLANQPFQTWKLMVKNQSADLITTDGNNNVLLKKHISFTDFPLPEVTLWVEDDQTSGNLLKVILLPSEH